MLTNRCQRSRATTVWQLLVDRRSRRASAMAAGARARTAAGGASAAETGFATRRARFTTARVLGAGAPRVEDGEAFPQPGFARLTVGAARRPGQRRAATLCDFRVDLGALTLIGPTLLTQPRTCISGRQCFIHGITGYHSMGVEPYPELEWTLVVKLKCIAAS